MYKFYNIIALEEEKILGSTKRPSQDQSATETNFSIVELFKTYVYASKCNLSKYFLQDFIYKKKSKPLVTTTERIVDMILSVKKILMSD